MVHNNRSLLFTPAERAILLTLLYSDIFSFPLTKDELWKLLISEKKITRAEFDLGLKSLPYIICQDGYYCLPNRKRIITQRKKNLPEVSKKMHRARHIAGRLSKIPSVLFIGISGSLAVGSASAEDDIDFVIITKKNTLFSTRFLIICMLHILRVRRFRNQKETADTICVNLLFDEAEMTRFTKKQDIYTAREIAQIFPLFERNNVYSNFLKANKWIKKFLPNIVIPKFIFKTENVNSIHPFFEWFFRSFQLYWMRRHQTNEVITKNFLAFHPNDYRILTLGKLRLKMLQFGLLTKF